MSFGPKLEHLPAVCSPNEEVLLTLEFMPECEDFERELKVFVEELAGIRTIDFTVKSAPREAPP